MAQTAAWLPISPTASAERRSEFGMNVDNPGHTSSVAPRPIPPSSELNRWDLAEILNPQNGGNQFASSRDRKLSMDFGSGSAQGQHSLYGQPELDPSFNLHSSENSSSSPSHHHLGGNMQTHTFDHPEALDQPEHPNYDLFPASAAGGAFSSQRYRTNASSSSSLGPSYNMNGEPIYSHAPFNDSVPAFSSSSGGHPYDISSSLPSSYGSGKVSPLTPSDSVSGLHHPAGFPPSSKDYSPQNYGDMPDRRLPGAGGYQSEYPDEYAIGSINNGLPFPPSALQHFQDRLGRFPPENRFGHQSGPPSSVPSHLPPSHVAPHATHSFREGGVSTYEDMPHYMSPNPHQDLSLRMPTVDETLARMKLQGHSIMGASNDLQTFIRYEPSDLICLPTAHRSSIFRPYLDQYVRTPNRLAFGERTIIVMSSKVAQKSYGTEKR